MNKIQKLAAMTLGNDLTSSPQEQDTAQRLADSEPVPQQPMAGTNMPAEAAPPAMNYNQLVQGGVGAPRLSEQVTAALAWAGMEAHWAVNYWKLMFKDKRSVTKRVGGRVVTRDSSGVSAAATIDEWITEINAISQNKVFGPGGLDDGTTR
jgi:hypothetical protein